LINDEKWRKEERKPWNIPACFYTRNEKMIG
jgi:hypothetical protein